MTKHGIEGEPEDYCLVQLTPGGGMYVDIFVFQYFTGYINLILFYWDLSLTYYKSFSIKPHKFYSFSFV